MQRLSKWSSSLVQFRLPYSVLRWQSPLWTKSSSNDKKKNKDDNENEWNDAWETAWLPDDLSGSGNNSTPAPAPWESDVNLGTVPVDDPDAKAFVEDMNANWDHRRTNKHPQPHPHPDNNKNNNNTDADGDGFYSMKNVKRDYRLKKQRIHASLWSQQIHLLHEAKLRGNDADDIDKLLDSCSQ